MAWHSIIPGGHPWVTLARLMSKPSATEGRTTAQLEPVICNRELPDLNLRRVQVQGRAGDTVQGVAKCAAK
jgi:hypothetical protein